MGASLRAQACVPGKRSAPDSSPGQPAQAAAALWVSRQEPALPDSICTHMHPALCLSVRIKVEGSVFFPVALAQTDRSVYTFSSLLMHGNRPFPAFHTFSESLPPHLLLTGITNVLWTYTLMCNGDNKREF